MSFGISGLVPGERLASLALEENSDTFTSAEVVLGAIAVPILKGHVYKIGCSCSFSSNVDGDRILAALTYVDPSDLDSTSNVIQQSNVYVATASFADGFPVYLETELEAAWTGEIRINLTGDRIAGSGNCYLVAAPGRKGILFAEYAYEA